MKGIALTVFEVPYFLQKCTGFLNVKIQKAEIKAPEFLQIQI